ncbi:hypothetical protein CBR_g46414 [Chara braunii]|uniref:Uncharacterized protein n=1 Tax=Chara braunii TaxID=69332 RepID=A0A388M0K9_CHABU|nr:hypothetical protein CBR_g46414 [Chara braunii]|eukprot:GBG88045.1 hypothetical protein CBR_g46414 [Chara braunii]
MSADRNNGDSPVVCPVLYRHAFGVMFTWNTDYEKVESTEEAVLGICKRVYLEAGLTTVGWNVRQDLHHPYVQRPATLESNPPCLQRSGYAGQRRCARALYCLITRYDCQLNFHLSSTQVLKEEALNVGLSMSAQGCTSAKGSCYDIKEMFSSIPHEAVRDAVFELLRTQVATRGKNCLLSKTGRAEASYVTIKIEDIYKMVVYDLSHAYMVCGEVIKRRVVGILMGKTMSPVLATVTCAMAESKFLQLRGADSKLVKGWRMVDNVSFIVGFCSKEGSGTKAQDVLAAFEAVYGPRLKLVRKDDDTNSLNVIGVPSAATCISNMLAESRSLTHFKANRCVLDLRGALDLVKGVTNSISLQECSLSDTFLPPQALSVLSDGLASAVYGQGEAASAGAQTPLPVAGPVGQICEAAEFPSCAARSGKGLSQLRKLELSYLGGGCASDRESAPQALARLLRMNNTLKELRISNACSCDEILSSMEGLRGNHCLEVLQYCSADPHVSTEERARMLCILDHNTTLKRLLFGTFTDAEIQRKLHKNNFQRELLDALDYASGWRMSCFLGDDLPPPLPPPLYQSGGEQNPSDMPSNLRFTADATPSQLTGSLQWLSDPDQTLQREWESLRGSACMAAEGIWRLRRQICDAVSLEAKQRTFLKHLESGRLAKAERIVFKGSATQALQFEDDLCSPRPLELSKGLNFWIEVCMSRLGRFLSLHGPSLHRLRRIALHDMVGTHISEQFLMELGYFLRRKSCLVQELVFTLCDFSMAGRAGCLIGDTLAQSSSLTVFHATSCSFGFGGAIALVEGITRSNSLQECDLSGTLLPGQALTVFANNLASTRNKAAAAKEVDVSDASMESGEAGPTKRAATWPAKTTLRCTRLRKLTLSYITEGLADHRECASKAVARLLTTNDTLKELHITNRAPVSDIIAVLEGLADNNCLETLRCSCEHSGVTAEEKGRILFLVDKMTHIKQLHLGLSVEAEINTKLRRYALEREFLRSTGTLEYVSGRHIRCFLVGHPRAGKTTLRKSLCRGRWKAMVTIEKPPKYMQRKKHRQTRGIETKAIRGHGGISVQLWDVAGQEEYHTMHDLFMPTLGDDMASPSMFLLICNPADKKGWKSEPDLRIQLGYWLKFIGANTVADCKPLVVLVFNPHDQNPSLYESAGQAGSLLDWVDEQFGDKFNIAKTPFVVDARRRTAAKPVHDFLIQQADLILREVKVLKIVDRILSEVTVRSRTSPLISWKEFDSICQKEVCPSTAELTLPDEAEPPEKEGFGLSERTTRYLAGLTNTLAHYLHDIGVVIWFREMPFLVASPEWFCSKVVGEIIPTECSKSGVHDGIASHDLLVRVLSRSFPSQYQANVGDLITLMVKMHLGYEFIHRNEKSMMMPACLPEWRDNTEIAWKVECKEEMTYFGFRIECNNKKQTMLTTGFFHRLQVQLHGQHEDCGEYQLAKDLIYLVVNGPGAEVYLEFSGFFGDWIDVMVKCPSDKFEDSKCWVEESIISNVHCLCREPTGLPGVSLMVKVIRPKCVEELVPRQDRSESQVVGEQEILHILRKSGPKHYYVWPELRWGQQRERYFPRENGKKVFELLRPSVIKETMETIITQGEELRWFVKELTQRQVAEGGLKPSSPAVERSRIGGVEVEVEGFLPEPSQKSLSILLENMQGTLTRMMTVMTEMHRTQGEMFTRICSMLNDMHRTQGEMFTRICGMLTNLSRLATEKHTHRLPHLLYFTEKVGRVSRLAAWFGRPLGIRPFQLHLMCESRAKCHVVEKQPGLQVWIQERERENVWVLLRTTLLILTVLMVSGCGAMAGIHALMPDMSAFTSDWSIVVSATATKDIATLGTSARDALNDFKDRLHKGTRMFDDDLEADWRRGEAFLWLEKILSPHKIQEQFGLTCVKYTDNSSIAWICRDCFKEHHHEIERFT